jgi:hypothetical protein
LTSELLLRQEPRSLSIIARESLIIAGWVAMWRPIRIFLYDWWPLLRLGHLYEKMSRMRVEVRKRVELRPQRKIRATKHKHRLARWHLSAANYT